MGSDNWRCLQLPAQSCDNSKVRSGSCPGESWTSPKVDIPWTLWASVPVLNHPWGKGVYFPYTRSDFPCCKLCPLSLALCHSEKSLDQSSLKSPFRWLITSVRPSPFSLFSFRLSKPSFCSFSSCTIAPTSQPSYWLFTSLIWGAQTVTH